MKDYKYKTFDELNNFVFEFPSLADNYHVETAGFVPLDIRMKQLIQNGYVARFTESDFDSQDLRLIWDNPDLQITGEDDFEDVQKKLFLRRQLENQIKNSKVSDKVDTEIKEVENPPTQSAE